MDLLSNFYSFTEESKYCLGSDNKNLSFFVDDNMTAYKLIITAISLDDFKKNLKDSLNKDESFNKLNMILLSELEGIEEYKIDICSAKLKFLVDSLYKRLKVKERTDFKKIKEEKDDKEVIDIESVKPQIDYGSKVKVFGSVFKKKGIEGDFDWQIKSHSYDDSLFLFNDDEERNRWKKAGQGNAIIRKYNKYAIPTRPRSVGIVTGKNGEGYDNLTPEVKKAIDKTIEEAKEIIKKYSYKRVYYSATTPNGILGTSIFKVGDKVLNYITEQIKSLGNIDVHSQGSEKSEEKIEDKVDDKKKSKNRFFDKTFTLTFGDQGENHVGMQKIGSLIDEGFSIDEILKIKDKFDKKGYKTEYYILNDLLPKEVGDDIEKAGIVVVRNGLNMLLDNMENGSDLFFNEQDRLSKDSKALMRGRVVNKHARYNLCFSDFSQKADFDKGKGTVINFKDLNLLNTVRNNISKYFGKKGNNLIAEGNYYYDTSLCGIGYHGDSERKVVIGIRVGKTMPLHFRWYNKHEIVSSTLKISLNHGDIYFSSEKAVGFDWKRSSKYTLRHAAGCDKFLDTESDIVIKEKKYKI
jgi:hypothetical protein